MGKEASELNLMSLRAPQMLRLMDVIDVRHYMSLVPQSDAEQPARELLEEQEMNRCDRPWAAAVPPCSSLC